MPARLLAEFLGTALLLAVVIGSGVMAERLAGGNAAVALLANTLATVGGLYVLIELFGPVSGAHFNPAVSLVMALRAVNAWRQWAPIVAALGFARLHLAGRDGPWPGTRRWLTQAVFPFYIAHQTIIVVAAPWLARQGLHQGLEAALLVTLTAAGCVLVFVAVRRVPLLAACMGVERAPAGSAIMRTP